MASLVSLLLSSLSEPPPDPSKHSVGRVPPWLGCLCCLLPAHLRLVKLEEIRVLCLAHHGPASPLDKPFAFVSLALCMCERAVHIGAHRFIVTLCLLSLSSWDDYLRQGAVCSPDGLDS